MEPTQTNQFFSQYPIQPKVHIRDGITYKIALKNLQALEKQRTASWNDYLVNAPLTITLFSSVFIISTLFTIICRDWASSLIPSVSAIGSFLTLGVAKVHSIYLKNAYQEEIGLIEDSTGFIPSKLQKIIPSQQLLRLPSFRANDYQRFNFSQFQLLKKRQYIPDVSISFREQKFYCSRTPTATLEQHRAFLQSEKLLNLAMCDPTFLEEYILELAKTPHLEYLKTELTSLFQNDFQYEFVNINPVLFRLEPNDKIKLSLNGNEILAKKPVLINASPFYQKLFHNSFAESKLETIPIALPGVELSIFQSVIEFLHNKPFEFRADRLDQYLYIADIHCLPRLLSHVEELFVFDLWNLPLDSVEEIDYWVSAIDQHKLNQARTTLDQILSKKITQNKEKLLYNPKFVLAIKPLPLTYYHARQKFQEYFHSSFGRYLDLKPDEFFEWYTDANQFCDAHMFACNYLDFNYDSDLCEKLHAQTLVNPTNLYIRKVTFESTNPWSDSIQELLYFFKMLEVFGSDYFPYKERILIDWVKRIEKLQLLLENKKIWPNQMHELWATTLENHPIQFAEKFVGPQFDGNKLAFLFEVYESESSRLHLPNLVESIWTLISIKLKEKPQFLRNIYSLEPLWWRFRKGVLKLCKRNPELFDQALMTFNKSDKISLRNLRIIKRKPQNNFSFWSF